MNTHTATSKVELHISYKDLIDLDIQSKTDPFCVVYLLDPVSKNKTLLGHTEVVQDRLTGDFITPIIVEYYFEFPQDLIFEMYDVDDHVNIMDLKAHDFVGYMECNLAEILISPNKIYNSQLINPERKENVGYIAVHLEEVAESHLSQDIINFQVRCRELDPKNVQLFFRKSDPFIRISRIKEDGSLNSVFESKIITNDLNPVFDFTVNFRQLSNCDINRLLRFEVWSYRSDGDHKYIGCTDMCLREIVENSSNPAENVVFSEHKRAKLAAKGKSYSGSGFIVITADHQHRATFIEYVTSGYDINLTVAIDMTGSNLEPTNPNSLHYIGANMTQYEMALNAVGSVVAPYDRDGMIGAFGFGGKPNGYNSVEHCFPLGDYNNGNVKGEYYGLQEVIAAYKATLRSCVLYGPTMFSQIINALVKKASDEPNSFQLLLLLTDGQNNDQKQTIEAIVKGSNFPLAIIIVGVGNADFSQMVALDSDESLLTDRFGNVAKADIVQFVEFNRFFHNPQILAAETLAEFPEQFVNYMHQHGIKPLDAYVLP
eukprot:TRINITY_DN1887_c0_g1_i1.p2 TRINITY_DN1887_c0_g1~~TRINITY_DN1887_c0_g1_i1.p2  ORF type:complete len:554 (-),score=107.28 TRINITY_DN1887_c0_g1_i1:3195-4823(-)